MRKVVIFALALLCAPAGLFGQGLHPDSLFPRLIGQWVLRGTIARQQTVHDVTFEWLLGREYVQMHEVSRERAPNGTPAYEAVVIFGRDPKTGAYACMWMDNTAAAAFPPEGTGRGSVAGDSDSLPLPLHRDHELPHDLRLRSCEGLVAVAHGQRQFRSAQTVCAGHPDAAVVHVEEASLSAIDQTRRVALGA